MKKIELNGKILVSALVKGLASIIMLYMVYLNQCNKLPIPFIIVVALYILFILIIDIFFKLKKYYPYVFAMLDSLFLYFMVLMMVWFIDLAILEINNKFVMPVLLAYNAVSLPIIIIGNLASGAISMKINKI